MPEYDNRIFSPAAPVALVTLSNLETSAAVSDVRMLIDSGADVTLVPASMMELLGIAPMPNERYELAAFNGRTSAAQAVRLHLILLGKTFSGRFLLIEQDWGILGRDVLNYLRWFLTARA